jgi:hypothetical protein
MQVFDIRRHVLSLHVMLTKYLPHCNYNCFANAVEYRYENFECESTHMKFRDKRISGTIYLYITTHFERWMSVLLLEYPRIFLSV